MEELTGERQVQSKRRRKNGVPLVAMTGYTNAGKSTIMNGMIDIYVKDE